MIRSAVVLSGLLLCLSCGPSRSSQQTKIDFNEAIIKSDGAKLYTVLRTRELNGATAEACQKFLDLVTKPIVSQMPGNSSMSWQLSSSGGANMVVSDHPKMLFDAPIIVSDGENKTETGFATLAFWAAHIKSNAIGRDRIGEAEDSHALVESWVPEFEKAGIKGSIDSETNTFMTWKEILASSRKEIDEIKSKR